MLYRHEVTVVDVTEDFERDNFQNPVLIHEHHMRLIVMTISFNIHN